MTALRKLLEFLVLAGLDPIDQLPPLLGILEEVFEEKNFKKVIFEPFLCIDFSKKWSKKSNFLDKIVCRSYCTVWWGIFFRLVHLSYYLAVDQSFFLSPTPLYRASGDKRSEASHVKIAFFLLMRCAFSHIFFLIF